MSTLTSRKRSTLLKFCMAVCLLTISAITATAATYTVTNTNDSGAGSLRQALIDANSSADDDIINFALSGCPCVITLTTGELSIASNGGLTINGPGADQLSVSGNNTSRVIFIGSGADVVINGMTLTGGNGVGQGGGNGGGIYNSGNLTLVASAVSNNVAAGSGGGVFDYYGSLTANNSTIANNSATFGGGISNFRSTLTLNNSTVSNNSAGSEGGGFDSVGEESVVTLTSSIVSGNTAGGNGGGGIRINSLVRMTIISSTVSNNFGAGNAGGGILSVGCHVTVIASTVASNRINGNGGGISGTNGGTFAIVNSTISSNTAEGGQGGGIHNRNVATTVTNSTLSGNSANQGGGIFKNLAGTITLANTIVANSIGGDCINDASSISASFSLIEDGLSCVNGTNINNLTGDPVLGPLQDNGGPIFMHPLLPGSPAIDSGGPTDLTTDQRGFSRTIDDPIVINAAGGDGTDIGAVESNYLTVNTTAQDDDGACQPLSDGDCTLREAILAANAGVGTETIIFDIPTTDPGYDVDSDRYTITLTSVLPDLDSDLNIEGLGAKRLIIERDPNAPAFRIFKSSGTVAILGLTISGGSEVFGGGIQNSGTLSLTDCSIMGNYASGSLAGGGGIFNDGTLTVTGSTISGNASNGYAGGIRNFGRLTVRESTISGNFANRSAGGIESIFGGTMTVTNSTISGNHADADANGNDIGGGVYASDADDTFYNTIVAGNFVGTAAGDIHGSIESAASNLIGDAGTAGGIAHGVNGNIVGISGAGRIDINKILSTTLADNGGSTKTHALVCGSPAIDVGKNFAASGTDQRGSGFARTFDDPAAANAANGDGTDIGAFELQEALVCNTVPAANDDSGSTDEDATLSGSSVLANDTDGEGDTLTAVLVSGPANAQEFTLNEDGTFSYIPSLNFYGTDSFTYKANDGALDSNVATVTITVRAVNDAPTVSLADPATQTVQYSDNAIRVNWSATDVDSTSLIANLEYSFNGGAFAPLSASDLLLSLSINCNSGACLASVYGSINIPAGVYTIRFKVRDAEFTSFSDHVLTVTKEHTETAFTGDVYALTAGPTVTTANVRLGAQLTQVADGYPGDITKANVSFLLFKAGTLGSTPDVTISGVPVDASGSALTFANLPVETWTVKVKIDADNGYWKARPVGMGTITIEQPTKELRTSGGGWVNDGQSLNEKGNFGFTVANQKKGVRGSSIYLFRGLDGFNYLVKSTSWNSGGVGFRSEGAVISLASFSGKCVVQKIDPETGEVVESFGNYSFTVDVRDGDLFKPRQPDKYAITILDSSGLVWRQVGSRTSPPVIGGGNVTVKGK